jgi:hypothetical protein
MLSQTCSCGPPLLRRQAGGGKADDCIVSASTKSIITTCSNAARASLVMISIMTGRWQARSTRQPMWTAMFDPEFTHDGTSLDDGLDFRSRLTTFGSGTATITSAISVIAYTSLVFTCRSAAGTRSAIRITSDVGRIIWIGMIVLYVAR